MNVSNLELILVQKISNSTSTLDTLIYSKALQELKTGTVTVVNTTSDLPSPNTAFIGHLFYEKSSEAMYIVDQLGYARKIEAGPTLFTWGRNINGQLGDGTATARCSPGTTVGGGTNWCGVLLSTFATSAAVVKNDGTLWTWGCNAVGQLGDATTTSRCSPVTTAGGGTNWCTASVGNGFMAAIKTDGTLWTWGSNGYGNLGDGTTTSRSSPGTTAGGGTNWCVVSAANNHVIAVKTDGTLWTWGGNGNGQLGTGNTTSRSSPGTTAGGGANWCYVSSGGISASGISGAIKTDGTLWTWGNNCFGGLGDGTTNSRSSPGSVAGGGSTWCTASFGSGHASAIKTDGTLWTWGLNCSTNGFTATGQLGDGTTTNRSSPGTTAGGGTNWCLVSAGYENINAIKTDGTLWTWGRNGYGQLGDGTSTNRCSPGTVAGGGTNWFRTAQGLNFSIGIKLPK